MANRYQKSWEDRVKDQRRRSKKGFDHRWPLKRSRNIEAMITRMGKDPSYLFEIVASLLHGYADIPWKMGDENMSILISWCAAQMSNYQRDLMKKPKRKTRHKAK